MDIIKTEEGAFLHSHTLTPDESLQTCSFEEGETRYAIAFRHLESLRARLSVCLPIPMTMPDLDSICRGSMTAMEAPRVPDQFQLQFLLKNLNTIAGDLQYTVRNQPLYPNSANTCLGPARPHQH